MPLSIKQKEYVLCKMRSLETDALFEPLMALIHKGVKVPVISNNSPFKEYLLAYEASKDYAEFAALQLELIKKYIKQFGCSELFASLTQEPINAESFSDEFLEYCASHFGWSLTIEPSVELTISQGKVYWKIIQDDSVLYNNVSTSESGVVFAKEKTIKMSWSNFRKFKDAGKRESSIQITKDRFFNECSKLLPVIDKPIPKKQLANKSVVHAIWDELKAKGILDKNDRLTHFWYSHSGTLKLDSVISIANSYGLQKDIKEAGFLHTEIAEALHQASINYDYRQCLPGSFEIFRPARMVRDWKATGALHFRGTDKQAVRLWDVGSYIELKKQEVVGDELEHDHIPSQCFIKDHLKQQSRHGYLDAEQYNKEKERSDDWGCIEVTDSMHHAGKTYLKSVSEQLRMAKPFFFELEYYINEVIKENPSPQYLIEVIGAFRYLFRCHIKEKFTNVGQGFFFNKPELIDDIDSLLLDKLSKAAVVL